MKYIQLNPDNLELSIVEKEPRKGFVIPTKKTSVDILERDFYGLVYFSVLYPYKLDEDKAEGKTGRRYKLIEPDPWLIALAAIMWQGLIQGLTWDIIKLSVRKGIDFLRSKKLVANEPYPKKDWEKSQSLKSSDWEIGISWTKFSENGEPLNKFFLGVKREFEKKSEKERELIKSNYIKKFSDITKQSSGRKKSRR